MKVSITTDTQIRSAKPGRYALGNNLFLLVRDSGLRQFSYRGADGTAKGTRRLAKLGEYPTMTLAAARAMALREKAARMAGTTLIRPSNKGKPRGKQRPSVADLGEPMANPQTATFGDWCDLYVHEVVSAGLWKASSHNTHEKHIGKYLRGFGFWGDPLPSIEPADVSIFLNAIYSGRHVAQNGRPAPSVAKQLLSLISYIFRFAVERNAKGVTDPRPFVSLGASVGGRKGQATKHFPSLKDLNDLGGVLRELRDRPALALPLRNACILQAFTLHRSAVIAEMRWAWFDLDAAVPTLRVPREFMKMSDAERGDFLMPISPFVADFVRKLPRNHPERLFVSARDKTVAMKSTALPQVYAKGLKLGGQMVPHGWRSAYSTWAHNLLDEKDSPVFNPVGVEFALDHEPRSQTRRAYDHVMIVHRANKMRAPLLAWQDILFRAMNGEHIPALSLSDLAA